MQVKPARPKGEKRDQDRIQERRPTAHRYSRQKNWDKAEKQEAPRIELGIENDPSHQISVTRRIGQEADLEPDVLDDAAPSINAAA